MKQRPAPDLSHITPEEWAYIAGFIDGEGNISVIHSNIKWCSVRISANQVDPRPLWWIQERLGGTVIKRIRKDSPKSQAGYIWVWQCGSRQRVYGILRGIWPYLIVKSEQCDLLLDNPATKNLAIELSKLKRMHHYATA